MAAGGAGQGHGGRGSRVAAKLSRDCFWRGMSCGGDELGRSELEAHAGFGSVRAPDWEAPFLRCGRPTRPLSELPHEELGSYEVTGLPLRPDRLGSSIAPAALPPALLQQPQCAVRSRLPLYVKICGHVH